MVIHLAASESASAGQALGRIVGAILVLAAPFLIYFRIQKKKKAKAASQLDASTSYPQTQYQPAQQQGQYQQGQYPPVHQQQPQYQQPQYPPPAQYQHPGQAPQGQWPPQGQ